MPTKDFELPPLRFYEYRIPNGTSIWLPIVKIALITSTNQSLELSLLFDTGADFTTLRADLYPVLGLQSWDQGQRVETATAGGSTYVYQYDVSLEIFGKTIQCPIHLSNKLLPHPIFSGLLGREKIFNEFGFGFWEREHELYVTANP